MLTLTFDNGVSTAISTDFSDTGILECALAFCKARELGGTITNAAGEIVGYVRRTASANSGWNAYMIGTTTGNYEWTSNGGGDG